MAAWVKKPHHWRSSLYSRIIRRRQRWIWRQSWGFWLGSGSARTKQRNLWSKDCKNGFRMLRSRTSTSLCTNVLLYYSLPESQCDGNFDLLLKVSKSREQFMVSSILPKNERKQFDLRYHSRKVFWENWEDDHKSLLKYTNLYYIVCIIFNYLQITRTVEITSCFVTD